MNNVMTTTTTMATISRLVLSLAVALVLGSMLAQDMDATKKVKHHKLSVEKRVQSQDQICTAWGGTFTSKKTAFGSTITTCRQGEGAGSVEYTCVHTKRGTKCRTTETTMTAPPVSGPDVPPTGGVDEGPTGGGANPGGGAAVDPPGPAEQPDAPVTIQSASHVAITADSGENDQGERDGKRNHRGHGGKRHKK